MSRYYKYVRSGYTDLRTGTVKQAPGMTVEMADCDPAAKDGGPLCGRGLHACRRKWDGIQYNNGTPLPDLRLVEVEIADSDILASDEGKVRCRKLSVIAEHPDTLGPRTEEVKALLRELPTWPWLKPQNPEARDLARLAFAVVNAANAYSPVECKRVRFVDRAAARAAARDAAWDAARDAAWDAATNASHLVADLAKPNLGDALCAFWKRGCWPVCVVNGEFILWAGNELAGMTVERGESA
jgi:hypothetical protein